MDFDWKALVRTVAPGIGTLVGGPFAGAGIKILADVLLGGSSGDSAKDEAELGKLMSGGITPELQAKLAEAERLLKIEMLKAGLREKEIAADLEKAYVADTAHARQTHQQNQGVLRLGIGINLLSYGLIAGVLWGCFELLAGTKITMDPTMAMAIGGIVGGAVQWIMSNAQQANGFFFGSSPGSRQMATDLSKSIGEAVSKTQPK